jgi:hypothetical protein
MSNEIDQLAMALIDGLGLPKHCVAINLRFRAGKMPTVTCVCYPDGPPEFVNDELRTELKRYQLVAKDSGDHVERD